MALASRAVRPAMRNAIRASCTSSIHPTQHISSYHSDAYPEPPSHTAAESQILSKALARVPEHGFTDQSLQLGAQDAGYLSISTNLLPRGVFELVLYHLVRQREELKNRLDAGEEGKTLRSVWDERKVGVGGRVRELVLERLKGNVESGVVNKWQEVHSYLNGLLQGTF